MTKHYIQKFALSFIFFIIAFLAYFLLLKSININAAGPNLSDTQRCLNAARFFENKYKIPNHLLESILIIESSRSHKDDKLAPSPWALNVRGTPYFFNTKNEAKNFISQQLEKNILSIDVGCAQINWYFHNDNFDNLDSLLNPITNVAYSAFFLIKLYEQLGNWDDAVSHYHSANKEFGEKYLRKVKAMSKKLSSKHKGMPDTRIDLGHDDKNNNFSNDNSNAYEIRNKNRRVLYAKRH